MSATLSEPKHFWNNQQLQHQHNKISLHHRHSRLTTIQNNKFDINDNHNNTCFQQSPSMSLMVTLDHTWLNSKSTKQYCSTSFLITKSLLYSISPLSKISQNCSITPPKMLNLSLFSIKDKDHKNTTHSIASP